jgi:hypothetical protein
MSSLRSSIKAIPGTTSNTPAPTLGNLERLFLEARSSFYSAKSVVDLITRYDLSKKSDEVIYAIAELLEVANEKLETVELEFRRLDAAERGRQA